MFWFWPRCHAPVAPSEVRTIPGVLHSIYFTVFALHGAFLPHGSTSPFNDTFQESSAYFLSRMLSTIYQELLCKQRRQDTQLTGTAWVWRSNCGGSCGWGRFKSRMRSTIPATAELNGGLAKGLRPQFYRSVRHLLHIFKTLFR